MQKTFTQAPLPFVGQKRKFIKQFTTALENIPGDGEGWIIVDVFGGSGFLSYTAKRLKPKARVIYNDFDGYSERLKHIDDINRLRRIIVDLIGCEKTDRKIDAETKAKIIEAIKNFDGYIDLQTTSSWLTFSSTQVTSFEELFKCGFYNAVRKSDYPRAEGYLDGLEMVCESFHTLIPKYQNNPKALLVLDPPYICTKQESYRNERYFDLIDFLRLVHLVRPPFVFFGSTKSEFIRFIEAMIEEKWDNYRSFENCERLTVQDSLNYQSKYEDNLLFKF